MGEKKEIIIDMDQISSDPAVLAKLHECASLMIQSGNASEVQTGYQMLEIVDLCMQQSKQT